MRYVSTFAIGPFNSHITAISCMTISHAPESKSSCLEGNFAIQSVSSGDKTDAFGLAPPSDEPGASSCFSHFSSNPFSSFSKAADACSSSLKEVHGGVANSLSSPCYALFYR